MKKYQYTIFGLNIESEIELPGLIPSDTSPPDTWIKLGQVPEHLENVKNKGVLYESSLNDFLFKLDNVGRYRVTNGKEITIQPYKKATPEEIQLFLLGSAMGGLLHQRGILPIHGSAISNEKEAIIIAGVSSSGKSSLAAAFSKRGYTLITDDVSVIGFENKKPVVHPGTPYLKLWSDVLLHLNESTEMKRVRPKLQKYYKPVREKPMTVPVFLKCIIILAVKNTPDFNMEKLNGADRFNQLWNNTYRMQYSENLDQSITQFKNLSKLANGIEVFRVERPAYPLQLDELADFIQQEIFSR
jgi:hypothetical protein